MCEAIYLKLKYSIVTKTYYNLFGFSLPYYMSQKPHDARLERAPHNRGLLQQNQTQNGLQAGCLAAKLQFQ